MEPIDMHELLERGPQGKLDELRIELYQKVNALGIGAQGLGGLSTVLDVKIRQFPTHAASQAGGDDPELCGDPPRALRARRLRRGRARAALARRLAEGHLDAGRAGAPRRPRPAHSRGSDDLEAGRHPAPQRQAPHRAGRGPQAHPGHAREGRAAAGRFHQPGDLLRRPGRPGARRSGRACRPDHRHADGQVHRDDARQDRPDRDDRQGRARPDGDRGNPQAQGGVR